MQRFGLTHARASTLAVHLILDPFPVIDVAIAPAKAASSFLVISNKHASVHVSVAATCAHNSARQSQHLQPHLQQHSSITKIFHSPEPEASVSPHFVVLPLARVYILVRPRKHAEPARLMLITWRTTATHHPRNETLDCIVIDMHTRFCGPFARIRRKCFRCYTQIDPFHVAPRLESHRCIDLAGKLAP